MTSLTFSPSSPLVADGAMGTRLHSYLPSEAMDTPFELLNLTRPELVQHVHREYVDAGADILTTNTFGASFLRLTSLGEGSRFAEVNQRGVELARLVATKASRKVLIAASVGPLGSIRYSAGVIRPSEIEAQFQLQMDALMEGSPDLVFIETMDEFREAVAAVQAALRCGLPVVAHLVSADGRTLGAHVDLYSAVCRLEDLGISAIGLNCRVGPEAMIQAAGRMSQYISTPLSLQPNAGNLVVDNYGRMEMSGDPESFSVFARACQNLPVAILGGCCNTTPAHIKAIRHGLEHSRAEPSSANSIFQQRAETGPRPDPPLLNRVRSGRFFTCVEIDPPTDAEVQADPGILSYKLDGARFLEETCNVDVITIADHTMGRPWLDGFPFAETLRPCLKSAELLIHYSCRNKAETDITGNFASFKLFGYRNILIITGDRPPSSECFYQYSSPRLIERVHNDHGDYFFLACSFDHTRGRSKEAEAGIDGEIRRLMRKIQAGAQLALTQPVYSADRLERLREKTLDMGIPVIPGIMPILSVRHAETVNRFPGIDVPATVVDNLDKAGEDKKARAAISVELSANLARRARELGFPGVYVITPMNRFDVVQQALLASK